MKRDFKGVWIPKEIYLWDELNWTEKLLLVEINSLDGEKGCFASNEHFANHLNKSKTYVSKRISKLKNMGIVYQDKFNGRQRVLRINWVELNAKLGLNKNTTLPCNKPQGRFEQNNKHNNTYKDINKGKGNKRKQTKESFNKFWDSYNYKIDKPRCKKYWLGESKLKNGDYMDDAMRKECLDAVPKYVKNTYKNKYPTRKHPATYLYNSSWENEVVEIDKDNGVYKEAGYEPGF